MKINEGVDSEDSVIWKTGDLNHTKVVPARNEGRCGDNLVTCCDCLGRIPVFHWNRITASLLNLGLVSTRFGTSQPGSFLHTPVLHSCPMSDCSAEGDHGTRLYDTSVWIGHELQTCDCFDGVALPVRSMCYLRRGGCRINFL